MNNKTALEQLEYWIEQYKRINGNPPIEEVLMQIQLLKDYEKEQLIIHNVSDMLCDSFDPDNGIGSATKCKCGREK